MLHSSDDIAAVWGEIAASAERRGRPRPQNDTWVAACCLAYELPLATLNVKDFRDFAQHEGAHPRHRLTFTGMAGRMLIARRYRRCLA